jgi:ubiquinone/menaquinone biosynthesis C-methylase UbiE
LLSRDDKGGYRVTALAERAFVPDRAGSLGPVLEAYERLHYPALSMTTEAIKKGTNAGLESLPGNGSTLYERLAENQDLENVFHGWMKYLDGIGHSWLAAPELGLARHVVDVGGGTGPNALLLKQFHPHLEITILDLPSICATVERKIERWGSAARGIRTHAGDFLSEPFPSNADVLLFVRVFNIYSPESNRRLLKKCWDYLPIGGSVIISNLFSNDDETGPLSAAHLSLYFHVLATGKGMVYPLKDYRAWFETAGFDELRVYAVGGDRVLVGRKA